MRHLTAPAGATIEIAESATRKHLNCWYADAGRLGLLDCEPIEWPDSITLQLAARGMEPAMPLKMRFVQWEEPEGEDEYPSGATYASPLDQSYLTVWA